MARDQSIRCAISIALSVLMATPPVFCQQSTTAPSGDAATAAESKPPMKQEELDQILAPVALYPDSLISQILMASTYPLEVVQADRWVETNKELKGDALATELEKQSWDPSVKSLVNFPQVLDMMNSKLDWTVKLGDAFLEQQKDVMNTIQSLRAKAQAAGNLTSNEQQTVTVEAATPTQPQVIVIQPANPQVIYVPTYSPTVVYGVWAYPAYPPYYYYPPGYVAGAAAVSFGVGLAVGMAWGYAWGGCNWHSSNVNVNINRNININNTHINRNYYQNNFNRNNVNVSGGQGNWKHDPSHRDGVAYRDRATAQQYGSASSDAAQKAREQYRGRADNGAGIQNQSGTGGRTGQQGQRPEQSSQRPAQGAQQRPAASSGSDRGGAFNGDDRGGGDARRDSQRGSASRGEGWARGGGAGAGRAGGRGRQ
jgi:hypothetical protein